MKKKILSVLAISFVLCTCLFALTACGDNEPPHTHNYSTLKFDEENHWFECVCEEKNNVVSHNIENGECACGYIVPHSHEYTTLKTDETEHWYECTCGDKSGIESHNGGTATCTGLAVCSVCNESYGKLKEHDYATLKNNETAHWYECTCGDEDGNEAHTGGTATCTELAVCSVCNESYGKLKEHDHTTLKNNETAHWYECVCGDKDGIEAHKDGTATCTGLAVCSVCNESYGKLKEHDYATLKNNETEHWHECVCGDKKNIQNHIPSAEATETTDQKCTVCDYIITPALGHVHTLHLTKVDTKPQSCTNEGNIEYYTCDCGKWFTDNTATTEITDKTSVVIGKDAHNHATLKNNETAHWYECVCGDKDDIEAHKDGTATCTELAVCSVCNESYGKLKEHDYTTLKNNENEHWHECVCGDKDGIEAHKDGTATCTELAVCSVCNQSYGKLKEHDYTTLKNNETEHWRECVCGDKDGIEAHKDGTATCTELAKCSVCGTSYGELKEHNHTTLKNNETEHWHECVCGDKSSIENHNGGTATCTGLAKCSVCNASYGELKDHNYATVKSNETAHWYECVCRDKDGIEAHKGGTATCTELAVCSVCNAGYGTLKEHNYNTLKHSETEHWYECVCGDKSGVESHNGGTVTCTELAVCSVCNAEYGTLKEHNYNTLKHSETEHWYECVCGDKSSIENHKGGTATCTKLAVCSVCNVSYGELKDHNYATVKSNETAHWYECTCGDKIGLESHNGGTATCTELAVCSVCSKSYGERKEHNHTALKNNETVHWYECICGDKDCIEAHNGGTATCTEFAVCSVCNESYGELKEHNYATLKNNETEHWYECICGDKSGVENHNGGTATCKDLAVCSVCNESYGELKEHNYATLKNNSTQHWYECVCGDKSGVENHNGGTATCTKLAVCSVCNVSYGERKEHNYATVKNNETEHWYECVCGDKDDIEAHKDGTATCTELAVCSVCNESYGKLKEHNHTTLKNNETEHWYECVCGDKDGIEAHKGGTATCTELAKCSVCNVEHGEYATTHPYENEWTYDENNHWHESTCDCEVKVNFGEHTPDDSGWCSVCEQALLPTKGVIYDVSADGTYAEVIGYSGTSTKVNIASTYNGLPVISICDDAFKSKLITTVVIPDSVTTIGNRVFYNCSSLTSVIIGNGVTSIGYWVFYECTSLVYNTYGDIQYLGNENNPYLVAMDTVNTNLSSYELHNQTKILGPSLFSGHKSLSSITIPDGVTTISGSFYGCTSLTSIVIPDSVTSIGSDTFRYTGLTSIVIPDSVTSIGNAIFDNCKSLRSVVIGDSVTSIGRATFNECNSLTSVVIGDSVTSIGEYAFLNCSSLKSVYYKGTASDWENISEYNSFVPYKCYYYSENQPTASGNYWHYDKNGNVIVW